MSHAHTFGAQSAAWLEGLRNRKRKPVSAATLSTYDSLLRRIAPFIRPDTELANINNGFLRDLATKLPGSPKTIAESLNVLKAVVASAVDAQTGESLYPRIWNHAFIDAPTVGKQKQPSLTAEQVNAAIKAAESWQEKSLYAVLTGSGIRISEALAIRLGPVDEDQSAFLAGESTIKVRASIFRGKERRGVLKTVSARRDVDLDPRLSAAIGKFAEASGIQPGQFLFQSRGGRVANLQTMVRRLKKRGIPGFHSFRRFRATRLREIGVSEDVIRFWLGHSGVSLTDRYSKLSESLELRRQWATRAGLGFDLSAFACDPQPPAPKSPKRSKPHIPSWRAHPRVVKSAKLADEKRLAALQSPSDAIPGFVATDEDLPAEMFKPVLETEEVAQ